MKQDEIFTEFIRHKVFDNYYYSLYVNGKKTNIYYPEIPNEYFLNTKEQAEREAELIKTGQVFPANGNYENFDMCGTFYANLQNAKKVDIKANFENKIMDISGGEYISEEKQNKALEAIKNNIAYWTQWTKRIDKKSGQLLHNIGIKFYPMGYTVFYY